MVRFIISQVVSVKSYVNNIYIPIWLDLLLFLIFLRILQKANLHSNMVRFIIAKQDEILQADKKFTFQYG